MASTDELMVKPQNGDENIGTNGDNDRLEYSGLSEENLNATDTKSTIAKEIVQDFSTDLEHEHGAPAPSAKAVKREINESHAFSDDEFPSSKTLTTLETVKKPTSSAASAAPANENDEFEICPIEADDDEFEEEPILLEVYNADDEHKETEGGESHHHHHHQQKQQKQRKTATTYETSRRERKQQFNVLTNDIGGSRAAKLQTPKMSGKAAAAAAAAAAAVHDDTIITPNKPIPAQSPGTIEIPRELITSDVSVISPIIINHVKNPSTNSDDLIAILEGDDNGCVNDDASVEHYELSLPNAAGNGNGDDKQPLTAEEEREIAMEQIMSLPKKKKGRPKLNQALKAARETKLNKKNKNALVNSLVSDWDEGDGKHDDSTENDTTEIVVEIRPQKKQAIVEPVQPTFRRSRIIKKKIIWDPDAPETAINYASLAHTSGAGPVKRQRKSSKPPKAEHQLDDDNTMEVSDMGEDMEAALSTTPAPKKKKTSEIDKLLGDEGAANMLNSLHQGNNNNNKVIDGASPAKIPRSKSAKNDACNVQNASNAVAKVKSTKPLKEVRETSPQKQQQQQQQHQQHQANSNNNKKNATPKSAAAGKKRGPKTSDSWDYIYKSRPDDCMIIRRRSNSSYSSTASLNRMSLDLPSAPYCDFDGGDNDHEIEYKPAKRSRSSKSKNFEFAKPKAARKIGKSDNDTKYSNSFDEAKNSVNEVHNVFANHKAGRSVQSDEIDIGALPIKLENGHDKDTVFTQISLCRFEKFTQIILHTDAADSKCLLTVQIMKEIETALHLVENDKNCKLILLTSAGNSFCNGSDYSTLVQSSGEKRRLSAIDLSKKLGNFVHTLATFKKPLVAYVNGLVNGLGARILPLFDVVWASDDATFNVKGGPSAGEIIEGTAIISLTDKIHYNAKAKLLFLNEVMGADEAKDYNVVTHVLKNDHVEQRVLIECNKLATKSILTLETCRLIQQQNVLPKLKDSLKIEQKQLLQQWTKSDFVDKLNAQHQ